MDDRDVPEEPDLDVVRLEILDRDRLRCLLQERFPIDERAVGVRAEEVVRQDLVEATDVRVLNGPDVVPVQVSQDFELGLVRSRDLRSLPRRFEKYLRRPSRQKVTTTVEAQVKRPPLLAPEPRCLPATDRPAAAGDHC